MYRLVITITFDHEILTSLLLLLLCAVFELFNNPCIDIIIIWSLECVCETFSFNSIIKILKHYWV